MEDLMDFSIFTTCGMSHVWQVSLWMDFLSDTGWWWCCMCIFSRFKIQNKMSFKTYLAKLQSILTLCLACWDFQTSFYADRVCLKVRELCTWKYMAWTYRYMCAADENTGHSTWKYMMRSMCTQRNTCAALKRTPSGSIIVLTCATWK
jgi:hypothetical protein